MLLSSKVMSIFKNTMGCICKKSADIMSFRNSFITISNFNSLIQAPKLNGFSCFGALNFEQPSAFRPTSVVKIPNRKSKINFYRAILITLLIWSTKVVKKNQIQIVSCKLLNLPTLFEYKCDFNLMMPLNSCCLKVFRTSSLLARDK